MQDRIQAFAARAFMLLLTTAAAQGSPAADVVYLGKQSTPRQSIETVDHSTWNDLLARYVDQDGRVNYRDWKASADDVRLLDDYLVRLSSGDPATQATREARLAFWINAYNAVTIRGILREYPTTSIRKHTAKLWGYNIWKHLQLYVGGRPYSLDQIEHEVLRKMNEPRIHFAIVCASKGCPRLLDQAYVPNLVDQQLETNAKDFFGRRDNFQYDANNHRFLASSILDWFGEDFGSDQRQRLARIAPWLPDPTAMEAAKANSVRVDFLDYDWSLNER